MKQLTPKQRTVLKRVWKGIKEDRLPPTAQEIADELGVTKTAAQQHLTALERKGCIERTKGKHRGLRLTKMGFDLATGARRKIA